MKALYGLDVLPVETNSLGSTESNTVVHTLL